MKPDLISISVDQLPGPLEPGQTITLRCVDFDGQQHRFEVVEEEPEMDVESPEMAMDRHFQKGKPEDEDDY